MMFGIKVTLAAIEFQSRKLTMYFLIQIMERGEKCSKDSISLWLYAVKQLVTLMYCLS